MRYAAFLRGINLGSHRKIPMTDLCRVIVARGFEDVSTYLRSGNLLFTVPATDTTALQETIREAISSELGLEVPVVVVSRMGLKTVIEACPYREAAAADPTKVHAIFLHPMPAPDVWPSTDGEASEAFTVGNGVVYMHLPDGMARARLPGELNRATATVTATTRNWRTVLEVAARIASDG